MSSAGPSSAPRRKRCRAAIALSLCSPGVQEGVHAFRSASPGSFGISGHAAGPAGGSRIYGKQQCARTLHMQADSSDTGVIPLMLRDVVIGKLQELGCGKVKEVKETTPGPGLHNRHFKYTTTDGVFFCKVSKNSSPDNFRAEHQSLQAISEAGCIRAPRPLAHGQLQLGGTYLLMEHVQLIPFGQSIPAVLEQLGAGLARMHLSQPPSHVGGRYGFSEDTFLGGTRQDNSWQGDFATFMIQNRLFPQLNKACLKFESNYGTTDSDAMALFRQRDGILEAAAACLEPVKHAQPSLLHGDLWVGNCGGASDKTPLIFDPACWYGHHEFDLALATMFGGFGEPFYRAYHALIPKADGFDERMQIYRLYHYLNHLNLHGAGFGYGGTVEAPKGYYERCIDLMKQITGTST